MRPVPAALIIALTISTSIAAQSTTGTIQGTIRDNLGAVVPGVAVTTRHLETSAMRAVVSDERGVYRFLNLPVGRYELKAAMSGFATHHRTGIVLQLDQSAVVDMQIGPAAISETVEVHGDASLVNTINAEVGVRFDRARVAELPVRSSRNVFALALSAPGVSELASGQTEFAGENRTGFSVNGMRLRSNNWMIDGQDDNDPNAGNRHLTINNTDVVQEIRLVTNQPTAEFGRTAGSVMNVITRSGTNVLHGSAFVFHNDHGLNSRSNLDKNAGLVAAPFRVENQLGGTLGGRIRADRTFFFASFQRWTDRRQASGFTLTGAPTEEGRELLGSVVGDRPQVQALLDHVPAGTPNGGLATFRVEGVTYRVPLGSLTGSVPAAVDNHQMSARIDHHLSASHLLVGRYLLSRTPRSTGGDVQVTPPGLTSNNPSTRQALSIWTTSTIGSNMSNELRAGLSHLNSRADAVNGDSLDIPSIEIVELGMNGTLATRTRTAFGLASNLPTSRDGHLYQLQDVFTQARRGHVIKAGFDIRAQFTKFSFIPAVRGTLRYTTLNAFVADVAEAASISRALPGGAEANYYRWWDQYYFVQDDWRIGAGLTLNLGVRYELPGNSIDSLAGLSGRIRRANGDDPLFALRPQPKKDTDNIEPRVGFNWVPTARGRYAVRGGYARTHDYAILNIAQNVAGSFPFVATTSISNLANAFTALRATPAGLPPGTDPDLLTRSTVAEDFRTPAADQFSIDIQGELAADMVIRVGYVGTFGRDLFQTLDGNPRKPFSTERVNPAQGVIRVRANTGQSWYHSVQTQLDRRFSRGLGAGVHYTWSRFEDTTSDIFNASVSEVAVAQDPFSLDGEKGRSTYDRPHRLVGNFVWEWPLFREPRGIAGRILGGWQMSALFTLQSGSPFTVLNGVDPTGALAGIDTLVGNAVRPNLNTDLDLSRMSVAEIREAGGALLFRQLCGNPSPTCQGERVGNVPRNSLRSNGIANLDLALLKNSRLTDTQTIQFRVELFNATNTRNFGVPDGRINSTNFLNQWATDGGQRRIWIAVRYLF